MGLLSGILTVGGAIVGGVVGGPAGASLGASLGGAVGGSIDQSNGTKKALAAQQAAAAQARSDRLTAASQVAGVQSPFLNFGGSAVNALTGRLGLNTPAGATSATTPTTNMLTATAPTTDWNQVLADRPDVLAEYQKESAKADPNSPNYAAKGLDSPQDFAQWWYTQNKPASDTYTAPSAAAPAATGTPTGADTSGGKLAAATGASSAASPVAGGGSVPASNTGLDGTMSPGTFGNTANPTYTAPAAYQAPTYTAPDAYQAPTYQDPGNFSYSLSDYQASPAYSYQQDQAAKSVLSNAGALGFRQSGAAAKELSDRAENIALEDFDNERNFAANQFQQNRTYDRSNYESDRNFGLTNYDDSRNFDRSTYENDRNYGLTASDDQRNFDRSTYENDRNYLTGQYNQGTSDLFKAAGVGQTAAGVVSNADMTAATGNASTATGLGNEAAGAALQQGNIGSNLANNVGGQVAGLVSNYLTGSVGTTPLTAQTATIPTATAYVPQLPDYNTLTRPAASYSF